jgi:hypothetical protein
MKGEKMDKLKLIEAILESDCKSTNKKEFWKIGEDYCIRTVTMIYIGILKDFNDQELLLEDVAWVPDTSRWNEFLCGKKPQEMEPYQNDVIIGRSAILDATILKKRIERTVI